MAKKKKKKKTYTGEMMWTEDLFTGAREKHHTEKRGTTQNRGIVANWRTAERKWRPTERFMSEARFLKLHVQRQGLRQTAPEGSDLICVSVTVKKHPHWSGLKKNVLQLTVLEYSRPWPSHDSRTWGSWSRCVRSQEAGMDTAAQYFPPSPRQNHAVYSGCPRLNLPDLSQVYQRLISWTILGTIR